MNPRSFPVPSIARALGALAVLASMALSQGTQVPCSTGQQPMCYREFASCSISPASNVDVYQFFGESGERVRITLAGLTGGFSPRFEVLRPSLTQFPVASPFCNPSCGSCACSLRRDITLDETGMYTVAIDDVGNNNTGNYSFDLQRLPPTSFTSLLTYGNNATVVLTTAAGHGWLAFDVARSTIVKITATGQTGGLSPQLELFDALGNVIASSSCNPSCGSCACSPPPIQFVPAQDERLFLAVSDAGNNNTGSISISLTCFAGTCPGTQIGAIGSTFCMTNANTTTNVAAIAAFGSNAIADNDIFVRVSGAPANKFAIFFAGLTPNPTPANLPFSEGALCLLPPLTRLPLQFTCSAGTITRQLDLTSAALAPLVASGQSTYFQAWFRDPTASGSTFDTNTSDGLEVPFQ